MQTAPVLLWYCGTVVHGGWGVLRAADMNMKHECEGMEACAAGVVWWHHEHDRDYFEEKRREPRRIPAATPSAPEMEITSKALSVAM